MEMKAFSMALKGVDDLRVAAENMSRELNLIKKHGYVPAGGITGEDSSKHVRRAMAAVESMAIASQGIDHPMVSSSAPKPPERGFSLWNAMNAVISPAQTTMTTIDETDVAGVSFGGSRNDSDKASSKHKSKSRRRKKKGDGGSVISSFF